MTEIQISKNNLIRLGNGTRVILTHAPMCNHVSDRITTDNDTNGNPLAAAATAS